MLAVNRAVRGVRPERALNTVVDLLSLAASICKRHGRSSQAAAEPVQNALR